MQITGIAGNTSANGNFKVTVIDANTFSLQNISTGANVAGNGVYTGGGTFNGGGSFQIRYGVDAPNGIFSNIQRIAWNPDPNQLRDNIQLALDTMFSPNPPGTQNAKVLLRTAGLNSGTNPAVYDINFGAGLSYVNIDDLSIQSNNLVGNGPVSPAFTNFVQGIGNEMQRISQTGNGQINLSFGGVQSATTVAGNATAAALQTYLNTISSPTGFQGAAEQCDHLSGNTTVFGQAGGPYYVVFRNQLAFTDVPRFFARAQAGTNVAITDLLPARRRRAFRKGRALH